MSSSSPVDRRVAGRVAPRRTRLRGRPRRRRAASSRRPAECNDPPTFSTHVHRRSGPPTARVYPSCTAETMAPEAAVGAAFPPPRWPPSPTSTATARCKFEVRSTIENESLGLLRHGRRARVVVIPIEGISCADRRPRVHARPAGSLPAPEQLRQRGRRRSRCPRRCGGRRPTGATASRSRSTSGCPRTPATCSTRVPPPASTARSSLAPGLAPVVAGLLPGQEALQVPAQQDVRRGRLQPDRDRRRRRRVRLRASTTAKGTEPVGYAPTAVTGFSVGYVIDRPGQRGRVHRPAAQRRGCWPSC